MRCDDKFRRRWNTWHRVPQSNRWIFLIDGIPISQLSYWRSINFVKSVCERNAFGFFLKCVCWKIRGWVLLSKLVNFSALYEISIMNFTWIWASVFRLYLNLLENILRICNCVILCVFIFLNSICEFVFWWSY